VISDRFDSSTFAYQICGHQNWALRNLFWPMRAAHLEYTPSPFYIYLDVDPEEGLRRAHGRGGENHFDNQTLAFHTRVRDGYHKFLSMGSSFHSPLDLEKVDPHINGKIINANLPIDEVVKNTIDLVRSLLA
jgi:thymidylate kinase